MQAANACNGFPSGANSCYVFTDSGTYDYLASGTDPAGTIPALKVVTQDNSANAPGGQYELINYFHGYIINPNKPGQTVNLHGGQGLPQLHHLAGGAGTGGGLPARVTEIPFTPTASPLLTEFAASRDLRRPCGQENHGDGNADQRTAGIPGAVRRASGASARS